MNGKIFQSYLNKPNIKEEYEGAFVFPPVQGVYKGGIATIDFNSLYPSSLRCANMSIETYVGKVSRVNVMFDNPDQRIAYNKEEYIDPHDETIDKLWLYPSQGKKRREISREDLLKLIETKCIYTRNNTLFLKHSVKQGVISAWCKHFYALRKSTKKRMQALDLSLYKGEVQEDKIEETKLQVKNLDADQHSLKIMLNSVYGMFGTNHSPIYSAAIAQSITRTGKFCNISASEFIRKRFKEMFNISDDYVSVCSGDTDSVAKSTKIHIRFEASNH
jgi:DNA polymerase elongation subunit (family B)